MKLPILILLSTLPILQAQETDTTDTSETNFEYALLMSPVFWVNMGLAIWGLLSLWFLVSRYGDFCLLAYLKNRGKRLNILLYLVVAFIMNHPVLNVKWFHLPQASKGRKLFNCMLSFSVFSLLCTLSIPYQVKEEYPLLQEAGFYIMAMPLFVDLYIAIGRFLFTAIIKLCFRLVRKESEHAPVIAEIILAIVTVICLLIELIEVIGKDRLRSDIWVKNFIQSLAPIMIFFSLMTVIIQTCIIGVLKNTSATNNPTRHKTLTKMAIPEMVSLMELVMPPKKSNEVELLEV